MTGGTPGEGKGARGDGLLAQEQDDTAVAKAAAEERLELYEKTEIGNVVEALTFWGVLGSSKQGDNEQATGLYEESLWCAEEVGDEQGDSAWALADLA